MSRRKGRKGKPQITTAHVVVDAVVDAVVVVFVVVVVVVVAFVVHWC